MADRELKSKRGEILRAWFDFVFGFENKKGDILGHWIAFHDNFNFSPQEFYEAIEKELQARKIPGMEISREEFAEGGLISDKRIYLRLFRERLALYTCAAPFGSGYFFSCRTVYVPALFRSDIDTLLLKIPGVSTIYEDWFRADTYYRHDTRLIYLQRIPEIIRELAEDITAAKGARLEEQYELQPILGELYKRVPPRKTEPEK